MVLAIVILLSNKETITTFPFLFTNTKKFNYPTGFPLRRFHRRRHCETPMSVGMLRPLLPWEDGARVLELNAALREAEACLRGLAYARDSHHDAIITGIGYGCSDKNSSVAVRICIRHLV